MEKSDCYYRRRQLLTSLEVPPLSEIKKQFGNELYEAFISQCPDALKPYVGLSPNLKGAGDDLWISPSDLLIPKVCLKPPLTNKHIRALTHQGILSIGREIEKKLIHEFELEKQKALIEQEELLLFMAKIERQRAEEKVRNEEKEICRKEKEQMRLEFEERLQDELQALEERLREEYEELLRKQKEELDTEWQEKLEMAVAETTARLTEEFLEKLKKQEEELLKLLKKEVRKEEIKRKLEVQAEREKCRQTFEQLKNQLQCKNIANMMYVLCVERRKCEIERETCELNHRKEIQELQAELTEKEVEITRLTRELEEKLKQIDLREECLLEILRQYQKFINFALRASPTQAEFLLSIEKMMVFELTRAVAKTDKKRAERLARTLLSWKSDSKSSSTTSKASLLAEDHHSCYNMLPTPPRSEHSLKSGDYLAAFHYDKHMYVREDFRNMMSQGIEISPSNQIWNSDVNNLMKILKRSVTSLQEQRKLEEEERKATESHEELEDQNVHFKKEANDFLYPASRSTSSVLSITASDLNRELSVKTSSFGTAIHEEKPCCRRSSLEPCGSFNKNVIRRVTVPLIGTRNSLELDQLRRIKQQQTSDSHVEFDRSDSQIGSIISTPPESRRDNSAGILAARDSLVKHRMSIKPASKLLLHRESIELAGVIDLGKRERESSISKSSASSKKISHLSLSRNSILVQKQSFLSRQNSSDITREQPQCRILTPSKIKIKPGSSQVSSVKLIEPKKYAAKMQASKISLSRDSVELIRSRSTRMSRMSGITKSVSSRKLSPPIILLDNYQDSDLRTVKMSHIEIVPIANHESDTSLNQNEIENEEQLALHSYDINSPPEQPWLIYKQKEQQQIVADPKIEENIAVTTEIKPRENFLTKPNAAEVLGDKDATEHLQKNEDFTLNRVDSMLNILKKHRSLIKMFISCTN